MRFRTRTLAVLATTALAMTACGGEQPVRVSSTTFDVTLDDYLIRPQQLRVPAGERLTVRATNRGRLGHTFRIRKGERNVLRFTTIRPGERASRSFNLAPGTYETYCALANHEELGMHGTLTVG